MIPSEEKRSSLVPWIETFPFPSMCHHVYTAVHISRSPKPLRNHGEAPNDGYLEDDGADVANVDETNLEADCQSCER